MEIVIKISDEDYQLMKDGHIPFSILDKMMNGTPLPKGHGRLIDADMLEKKVEMHRKRLKISEYDRDLILHYIDIEMASTIIEADGGGEDEVSD